MIILALSNLLFFLQLTHFADYTITLQCTRIVAVRVAPHSSSTDILCRDGSFAKSRVWIKSDFSAELARRRASFCDYHRCRPHASPTPLFEVSCALSSVPVRPAHNNVDDGPKLVKHQIRKRRQKICRDGASNDEDR